MARGYFPEWPLNTLVRLDSGDEVTICYSGLDGCGGCFGRHWFDLGPSGTGEHLPMPDVIFRPDGHAPSGHKATLRVVDVLFEVPMVEWSDGSMESCVWTPDDRRTEGVA